MLVISFSILLLLTKLRYLSMSLINIMVLNGLYVFKDSNLRIIRENLRVSVLSWHVSIVLLAEQ